MFDEQTQKLILLNSTAKAVWEGLQAGIKIDEILRILVEITQDKSEHILCDVNLILSQWQDLGLLKSTHKKAEQHQTANIRKIDNIKLDQNEKILSSPVKHQSCCFKLIDTIYRFYAPDQDVLNLVNQYVSHLLIDAPGLPDIELSVAKTDRRYILYKNKKPVDWCSHISSVVPALHATIIMNTYNKTTCLMGIHAAVVVRNNICILMPAKANSGKSTLTTALIHSGFTYGADDFVLLTSEPGKIIPVPSAIGLKKGSWPVIEKYHPKIRSCPVHKRSDDKMIKYLPPSEKENCYYTSLKPINVDYIVYPHYNPEYPLSLNKINPAQSICDLSTAGFYMHDKLDKERVRQLVDWMKITPSYRLGFSRLENAVTRLKSLCGSEGRERLSKFS